MCVINCFVRLLTIKSHFLSVDDDIAISDMSANTTNMGSQGTNEFDGLLFDEQISLLILQEMANRGNLTLLCQRNLGCPIQISIRLNRGPPSLIFFHLG